MLRCQRQLLNHSAGGGWNWLRIEVDTHIVETCKRIKSSVRCCKAELMASTILTRKTCTINVLHTMIWHQEPLLPPHKDSTSIPIVHRQIRPFELMFHMSESRKTLPMNHIFLLVCPPILGQKPIPTANYFCIEIRSELRPIICQAPDAKVATKGRGCKVYILEVFSGNCTKKQ
jgi:hypothetical protein